MMGGGFGGCTINLIESSAIDGIYARFSKQYQSVMERELTMYVTLPSEGSQLIKID
jgi:galactokinase